MKSNAREYIWVATLCAVLALAAVPAEAQRRYGPLFDKFNLKVEGSWVNISTEIRLDSEILGEGTTLNFENLGLAADKTIPTLAFEWQIAKRHRVGVRWQDINRSSTTHVEDEIQWGDVVVPRRCHAQSGLRRQPRPLSTTPSTVGQGALGGPASVSASGGWISRRT